MWFIVEKLRFIVEKLRFIGIKRRTFGIKRRTFGKKRRTFGIKRRTFGINWLTFGINWLTFGIKSWTFGINWLTFGVFFGGNWRFFGWILGLFGDISPILLENVVLILFAPTLKGEIFLYRKGRKKTGVRFIFGFMHNWFKNWRLCFHLLSFLFFLDKKKKQKNYSRFYFA